MENKTSIIENKTTTKGAGSSPCDIVARPDKPDGEYSITYKNAIKLMPQMSLTDIFFPLECKYKLAGIKDSVDKIKQQASVILILINALKDSKFNEDEATILAETVVPLNQWVLYKATMSTMYALTLLIKIVKLILISNKKQKLDLTKQLKIALNLMQEKAEITGIVLLYIDAMNLVYTGKLLKQATQDKKLKLITLNDLSPSLKGTKLKFREDLYDVINKIIDVNAQIKSMNENCADIHQIMKQYKIHNYDTVSCKEINLEASPQGWYQGIYINTCTAPEFVVCEGTAGGGGQCISQKLRYGSLSVAGWY